MENTSPILGKNFAQAVRRHWPSVTDAELAATEGDTNKLINLFKTKSHVPENEIREKLHIITEETQCGNPQSIDEFSGTERAQHSGPTPKTNEWEAREDENKRSPHV